MSPYRSRSQQALFHAKQARGEISAKVVHEWDEATKRAGGFKRLPQRACPKTAGPGVKKHKRPHSSGEFSPADIKRGYRVVK